MELKVKKTFQLSGSQMRSGPRSGDLPMLGLPSCNVGFRESVLAINKSIFTGEYLLTDLVYFSSSLYRKFHTSSVTWPLRQILAGSGRRRKCYLVLHLTVLLPSWDSVFIQILEVCIFLNCKFQYETWSNLDLHNDH